MIRSLYRSLFPSHVRNKIRKILGYESYEPIKKGALKDFIFIHIPKTGGTSVSNNIGYIEHRTAREIIEIIGHKKWNTCFKFAFVRNPWELVYSHYKFKYMHDHQMVRTNKLSFNDWVVGVYGSMPDSKLKHNPKMYMCQMEWLIDDGGKLNLDHIGKFENIENEYGRIAQEVGVSPSLMHLNRSDSQGYKSAYNELSKELVRTAFDADIQYWGFEY